ncbi:MAG: nucleoside deaminase [Candidatus Omnitrophota bacterium]
MKNKNNLNVLKIRKERNMSNDRKFMEMAIEEAYLGVSANDGGPFGAVIVKGEEVLATAHNTVLRDNDPVRHAEINAISLAAKKNKTYDLSGCVIYSTTEPCPMCFSAMHWARLEKLVYGTDIEDVKKLGFNELTIPSSVMRERGRSSVIIQNAFMRVECEKLLGYWDKFSERVVY